MSVKTKQIWLLFVVLASSLFSCSEGRQYGEIVLKNGNELYLVNRADKKIFHFGVESLCVNAQGDSISRGESVLLSPGDSMYIGKTQEEEAKGIYDCIYKVVSQQEVKGSN